MESRYFIRLANAGSKSFSAGKISSTTVSILKCSLRFAPLFPLFLGMYAVSVRDEDAVELFSDTSSVPLVGLCFSDLLATSLDRPLFILFCLLKSVSRSNNAFCMDVTVAISSSRFRLEMASSARSSSMVLPRSSIRANKIRLVSLATSSCCCKINVKSGPFIPLKIRKLSDFSKYLSLLFS